MNTESTTAWQCEIESADFEKGTVKLRMKSSDYRVSAKAHWLSTTPPPVAQRQPLTDEQIGRIAHNVEPEDWNCLHYRDSWHDGFKAGFREAETEHNMKDKT